MIPRINIYAKRWPRKVQQISARTQRRLKSLPLRQAKEDAKYDNLPKKSRVSGYWNLQFGSYNAWFLDYSAAVARAQKLWKRFYKESAAYSMCLNLDLDFLTLDENTFISGKLGSKCRDISTKQYGYIKGIYERQSKEW